MEPRRKLSRKELLASCAEIGPDDGVDPRDDNRGASARRASRKTLQLCRQVARTLNAVLGGCRDDVLNGLFVAAVQPAPNPGRLLVTVAASPAAAAFGASEVLAHLDKASSLLRCEVAAAIHRRRAPELAFRVAFQPDVSKS